MLRKYAIVKRVCDYIQYKERVKYNQFVTYKNGCVNHVYRLTSCIGLLSFLYNVCLLKQLCECLCCELANKRCV